MRSSENANLKPSANCVDYIFQTNRW